MRRLVAAEKISRRSDAIFWKDSPWYKRAQPPIEISACRNGFLVEEAPAQVQHVSCKFFPGPPYFGAPPADFSFRVGIKRLMRRQEKQLSKPGSTDQGFRLAMDVHESILIVYYNPTVHFARE